LSAKAAQWIEIAREALEQGLHLRFTGDNIRHPAFETPPSGNRPKATNSRKQGRWHMTKATRFLRLKDVKALCGLSTSSIYEMMSRGTFPRQISLGPKSVAWAEPEIAAWQAEQVAKRDAAVAKAARRKGQRAA
jgi:prophage regulatory protein